MQGELSQILIGSTPAGRNNYFFEIVHKPIGFKVFNLPVFDPHKFNPNVSILGQNLKAIAPWIDLDGLEIKRQRDINIFLQEQMLTS